MSRIATTLKRHWAITAARAADSKQATDVVVLDVAEVLALCGWFVIASAPNDRLVKAICDGNSRRAESHSPASTKVRPSER